MQNIHNLTTNGVLHVDTGAVIPPGASAWVESTSGLIQWGENSTNVITSGTGFAYVQVRSATAVAWSLDWLWTWPIYMLVLIWAARKALAMIRSLGGAQQVSTDV